MPTANLDWRGEEETRGDRNQIVVKYSIVDALNRADAFSATGLPDHNAVLEPGSLYRARNRRMSAGDGPRHFVCIVVYEQGDWSSTKDDDPVARAPEIEWEDISYEEPHAYDLAGKPVKATSNRPFDPPIPFSRKGKLLRITRNEDSYDYDHYRPFEDTINSVGFQLTGQMYVNPGECLCRSIIPAKSYTVDAPFVAMRFTFEFRKPSPPDPQSLYYATSGEGAMNGTGSLWPFDKHVVDQDTVGWCNVSGTDYMGPFCDQAGRPIDRPQLLDGHGKPLDTTVRVLWGGAPRTPVSGPSLIWTQRVLSPYTIKGGPANNPYSTVFLQFRGKERKNFSDIGLTL